MKSEPSNTPRTSAGISKSLLTPCRRLGLTRRRPTSASPQTPQSSLADLSSSPSGNPKSIKTMIEYHSQEDLQAVNVSTPARTLPLPRRQTSKKLISVISAAAINQQKTPNSNGIEDKTLSPDKCIAEKQYSDLIEHDELKSEIKDNEMKENTTTAEVETKVLMPTRNKSSKQKTPKKLVKQRSINLKKNCMVVLDHHLLKSKPLNRSNEINLNEKSTNASVDMKVQKIENEMLDIDDLPLSEVSKKFCEPCKEISLPVKKRLYDRILNEEYTDVSEENLTKFSEDTKKTLLIKPPKVAKLESSQNSSASSSGEMRKKSKQKLTKNPPSVIGSDSEDDDFQHKTILIRKSYPKVSLQKAKSTGSITQKDIDDIKLRIKMKQNALLAKSGGNNMEELTELIKKWRKGCQDALMELLEIMKKKVPDKRNMNTEELLRMLNIPPSLVDYNVGDDCFVSQE